jgi:arylsulfatase A-like enzyme
MQLRLLPSSFLILSAFFLLPSAFSKPNVLFIAVDDMNDWIGCLETTPRALTPNIDRLAKRGVNFTNAHTAGVFCAPSRAAIFSGQLASTTGCYTSATYWIENPEIEPMQVNFAKGGYKTLGTGKLFHHPAGAIDKRGWDQFHLRTKAQRESGWPLDSWKHDAPYPDPFPASIYNRDQAVTGGLFLEWGAVSNDKEEAMADTQRANWAVKQLQQEHDKPFFLGVGFYAPHFPNYCPQKYFDLYDPDAIELPPYKADDLEDLPPGVKRAKTARSRIHQKLESLDAVDDAIHGYLACISYADAMIGRVLDALDASPHRDNTIVVLWSDHGYHHGEKGDWGKHTLWERTSNVPFIWAGPGIAKAAKTDVTVSLLDMYPTLAEYCELPKPTQRLEGRSIAKILAKPADQPDYTIVLPHMNPGEYAIINRDWRFIHYKDGEELYNLRQDPNEWDNVIDEPRHAKLVETLRAHAPKNWAQPGAKFNVRNDLVVDGESWRWERGANRKNNSKPALKNVLLIVCDDLNTHVSPSGYDPIHTPTLANFAKESITFRRAFCQYPVCGPSRASILNGLYPESTGVLNNKADIRETRPGTVSMPQFFKENGYWTGSVGKVFHSPRHEHGDVAWSQYMRFENDELPVVTAAREAFEAEHGSISQGKNRKAWREIEKKAKSKLDAQTPPGYGRSGLRDDQHKDGKNARQIANWLRADAPGGKPFFIACGIQKPHVPFLAPDKYFDRYPLEKLSYTPDRPTLWDSIPNMAGNKRYEAFGFEFASENDALRREYMQAYHACISFIDAQVKLVFDALKSTGHWNDTIVIFTSDHGYHLGDHFLWGKVTLFDIGAKVPFMIRAPGLSKAGAKSQAMVELIDIYPTLADLTGLDAPDHLQGVSLRPLLGHPERLGKKPYAYSVVSRGEHLGYALRNQRWRYGKWPDGEELYNLSNDPEEKHNLAANGNQVERLQEFRKLLAAKQKSAANRRK